MEYDLSLDEMRALTNQRVKFVLSLPLMKHVLQDQEEKRKNFLSQSLVLGEVLCMVDVAMSIKCGILFLLFGGAVSNLGSPEHVTKWFQSLKEQKYTGMFAMTEKGHGSNVRGIQTQATFDRDNQEFVIDTPCENAQKMYIGNAMHGNYAAVFAQLIIEGKSQGPHCFIVPIRDESGNLYPGVTAIDMMHKEGMNGVDNGILIFDKVRIPREYLLDKVWFCGSRWTVPFTYSKQERKIQCNAGNTDPFKTSSDFPSYRRHEELGLTIAIRYSHSRRQFGPKGQEEVKIIEHQMQALRLMPHLATALALTFTSRGYMMENRIAGLKCDTDVFVTFEGDNVVMLQVVARELLAQYSKQHKKNPLLGLIWNWTATAQDKLRTSFLMFNTDTVGHLAFLLKAVNFRERVLQRSLVSRIYYKVALEQFMTAVRHCPNREDQALLMKTFCLLYGTKLVFQERSWYLEHKYLTPAASTRVRAQLLNLCESVKDDALKVISAFNIPHTTIPAPMAGISNPGAVEAFHPAPTQPLVRDGARSRLAKL
ncbi:Acyl-coenzyme A oxidase-like protein [Apodemus speciosus]|uniref:Acyl-coenzyme A oxidase-like protein n=1 Tax=Apodemus speciosus TaxID=105296 RepID=A0ABQ0EJB6_APOSI